MYLLTVLITVALLFAVFGLITATIHEYADKLVAVVERAEMLRAIKEDRERSPRYVHV